MTSNRPHKLPLASLLLLTLLVACSSDDVALPDSPSLGDEGGAGGTGPGGGAGSGGGFNSSGGNSSGGNAALTVGDATLTFASGPQAAKIVGTSDAWSQFTSDMERSLRMRTTEAVSEGALLSYAAEQARAWPAGEEARWRDAFAKISDSLEGLSVPLPAEVFMVRTSGLEEFGAYTRGHAIVIPANHPVEDHFSLGAHELFHVVTRHRPDMRTTLYGLLSFTAVATATCPASLESRRVTNPDAFSLEHALAVEHQGSPTQVMPFIQSKYDLALAVQRNEGFRGLELLLLPVDPMSGNVTGSPLPPNETNYQELMSRNTNYTIHPEEALADNFALMLRRRLGHSVQLDDVDLVDELEAYFSP